MTDLGLSPTLIKREVFSNGSLVCASESFGVIPEIFTLIDGVVWVSKELAVVKAGVL